MNHLPWNIEAKPVAERILSMYPELPKISAIHSEVISLEDPVVDPTIKKYVAIRPEIKEHMINNFEIPECGSVLSRIKDMIRLMMKTRDHK